MAAEHALAALRALHTSSDAQQRQAANVWLIEFTSSPEAFSAARELLLSGDEQAAFFGACTLHTKIAAEWHGMSELERSAVRDEMWRLLDAPGLRAVVVSRLALALAAVAGRSADEAGFLRQSIGMLRVPASRLVALRLIQAAADEFDPSASRRLSRDRDAGALSLASAWPEVWQGLAETLHVMRQQGSAPPGPDDPVALCLSSARALLRWAPLPSMTAGVSGRAAAASGAGGAAVLPGGGATELASLLASVSAWIAPEEGGDAVSFGRAGGAAECVAEVMGRKSSGAALKLATPSLLPALGGALRRLPVVVAAAGAAGAAAAAEEYGCRLCFCLCEFARNWLVAFAVEAAPSVVSAVGELLRDGALGDLLFWRCVEVCEAVVESQLGGEEGGESGLSGASGGASALLEQSTVEATMGCVPPMLLRLTSAAGAHGGAAVSTGDWIGGADAAAEAAHMQGAEAEDLEEVDEQLLHAGALCNGLLLALAAERPSAVMSGLTDALEPALAALAAPVGHQTDAAAARAGTLAALLGSVVPAATEARAPLSRLLHCLEAALPRVLPAARAGRPGQCAQLGLLRLLLCCCSAGCGGALEAEAQSSVALGFLLSQLLDVLQHQAETPTGAVPAATSLLVRALSRRWPAAVHATEGMARVRAQLLPLAPRLAPDDQPPMVAAAACAFLIPPVGASPPAGPEGRQLLDSLCASWDDPPPGADDAHVAAALEAAEPPARCLALLAELLAGETRQVKLALCAPVSPRLAPLLSLLGRSAALSPPPLARIGSLLWLLSALVRSAGSELGGRFVVDALSATLRAVGSAATALSDPGGAAGDADAAEAFLRSSIAVLREAAEPPLHRPPERAELLSCVLAALGPHALGSLLSPAAALRLNDARREELVAVAAAVVRGHWAALRGMPEEGAALLALIHAGLRGAASEPPCFAQCLVSFSQLLDVLLRSAAAPPDWLLAGTSLLMPTVLVARLDGAHDAAQDEIAACLHAGCTAVAQPPGDPTGSAEALITAVLESHASALPAETRRSLAAAFVRSHPRDLPTFGRELGRLANDVRHLLALAQRHGGVRGAG